jgi:hypothetical protein
VFDDGELKRHWNYNPRNRPFVVDFLYAQAFPRRPNMAALIEAKVLAGVDSAPRGFEALSEQKVKQLLALARADTRTIVD